MNNPMMSILNAIRGGQNPQRIMQQLAMSDPRAAQAQQMMAGKSPQQIRQICENMCRERGITPESVAQQLGIPGIR